MLNSYRRRYFLSHDGCFRVTIDNDMTYCKVLPSVGTLLCKETDHQNTVIELKYLMAEDNNAKSVSNAFPFRMTKNSKYVSGVSRVYGGSSF